jgi:plastocyanin
MGKQTVNIGSTANDGTGDPIRTAMVRINGNFTEVYNALGGNTVTGLVNAQNEIELLSTANKISFLYSLESEVLALDPATHHGSIAHAHDTGALYYAHGEWRKLLSDTSAGAITSYTDPLQPFSYTANITNLQVDGYVLSTNANGTYTWVSNAGGGGGSVASLEDLDNVTISNPSNDQVLKFNGSAWVNGTDASGSGALTISDEGSSLTTSSASINFVGSGVTATTSGDDVTVTISGGGGGTFADLTEVNAATLDVDDIALQATTNLVVTGPDSTKYLFDQYPGNNPTIYATRGSTIAFNLDGVTGSHPFRILTIGGGSQYDTGLVHFAQDGTKTTGSAAQDKTSGTLYWKIPGNATAGTYEYVCTVHAAMNGNIVVQDPAAGGGGGALQARGSLNGATSGSHADNTDEDLNITGYKGYSLLKIQTDRAAWVRMYITDAARTADAARVETTDPSPTAGVIAEVITTGAETVNFTPGVLGWNGDGTPATTMYLAVKNKSGGTSAVDVTITAIQLEA